MSLKGNTAIITGAGQGIGKKIAINLAKAGANIVVCDVNQENADKASEEIKSFGVETMAAKADVTDLDQISSLAEECKKRFGSIDILINNAGITKDGLMLRMKKEDWNLVINVNLTGVFNCTKAVSKYMIKQKKGKIVNITSIVGVMGNAGQANYSASKAGVIGFTKSIAREFAGRNINVNAVAPGFIETAMTDALSDDVKDNLRKQIPFGRLGQPQDIAKCVEFLVSENSAYITGQVIHVNGGMYM